MKKIAVLVSVLVLCLAVVGVGYAGVWSENIQINGTATTGTFDVTYSAASTADGTVSATPADALTWSLGTAVIPGTYTLNYTIKNVGTTVAVVQPGVVTCTPAADVTAVDSMAVTSLAPNATVSGTVVVTVASSVANGAAVTVTVVHAAALT